MQTLYTMAVSMELFSFSPLGDWDGEGQGRIAHELYLIMDSFLVTIPSY